MNRALMLAVSVSLLSLATSSMGVQPAFSQMNWAQNLGQLPQMADVGTRQTEMLHGIDDAVQQGRLNAQDAGTFRAELERIKQNEAQFRADGKLSVWEKMRLSFELDNLQKKIDASLAPRTSSTSDLPGRQADIVREISDALFTGRLTRQDGEIFLAEIDRIKAQEANFRADGSLNSNEMLTISLDLDKLQQSVHAKIKPVTVNDTSTESKKAEISRRVKDLTASGKITPAEANTFGQELSRIESKEASFKANDGRLDTNEALTLAIELENLSTALDRYQPASATNTPGINQRQQEIERLITDALYSGKLNSQQVMDLKQEFDRIAALEATYRIDGSLSDTETLTLARDLDSLRAKIELYGGTPHLQGISQRIADAKKRLADSLTAGRINRAAAQDLKVQIERIDARHRYFMQDGRLEDNETLSLASDVDNFRINLDKAVTPLPDVGRRRADIDRKVNEALASGRLKPADAESLKADLDRINGLESTFKGSEGGLSDQEIIALSKEYDAVSARIDKSLPALPDISSKEASIQTRINEAARSGAISEDNRRDFMHEFDRINDVENAFRSSDNGLSEWEVMTLARDLDRLDAEIARTLDKPVKIDTTGAAADTRGHWAEQYIALLSKRGTIGGFPDGSFKPNDYITRAQFAAIASRALNLPPAGRAANFKDVPTKYWAASVISQVSDAGLVTGFPDGSFRPEDKITRAQALVILAKALNNPNADTSAMTRFKDGNTVPTWALPSVAKAANARIIVSYPDPESIKPNELATRADVAALTYQTMASLGEKLPQIRVGLEASGK
ncbi:MAG: S-layer homology domain-containing protein [Candidatus Melainabacteria bacterium]|nr:S-layer homology domain-containing protein [Candidatus Melainabacteria bacterium]